MDTTKEIHDEKTLNVNDITPIKCKKKRRVNIILLVIGLVLGVVCITTIILSLVFSDSTIGGSIVRDINIVLISTTTTLLGLYVTAFIFLNDSLKNRTKEDPQIKEAVNDILDGYRNNMIYLAIGTIITIVIQIVCNVILGRPQEYDTSIENMRVSFNSVIWIVFILASGCTLFIIAWIILASKDIMSSDYLIAQQSERNLKSHMSALLELYQKVERGEKTKPGELTSDMSGKDIMDTFAHKEYSFRLAYDSLEKSRERNRQSDINNAFKSKEAYVIRFGKIVRFIESIVSRICDNNIDKSIMNGNLLTQSMSSGFEYLYCSESQNSVLDVRDEKRFLDHLKYQIITSKRFENKPFDNLEVEAAFSRAKNEFSKLSFSDSSENPTFQNFLRRLATDDYSETDTTTTQSEYIIEYKKQMKEIIGEFFDGFEHLVGYRDALVRYGQYDERAKNKRFIKNKRSKDVEKVSNDERRILEYAEIFKRVLIDRFTSFVKINDLNLGNSTLDKGWFNYSELSDSNFTHSSFRYARMENAILRNCDLSTCSFILADASDTDFMGSNFNYSDLTGMDLTDCNLNKTQMNSIILRDARIDNYFGLKVLFRSENIVIDELDERKRWQKSIRERAREGNSATSDEKIREAFSNLRDGKAIREDILGTISGRRVVKGLEKLGASCCLPKTDTNTQINTDEGCVLDESYKLINEYLTDFIKYRKYNKVSREIYNKIPSVREKEDILFKDEREKYLGKIYFGVASLRSASVNEVLMKDIDFSFVPISEASFRDSDLSGAEMYYTMAQSVMFHRTNLNRMDAYISDFKGSNFCEATLVGSTLTDCNFQGCNFSKALLLNSVVFNTNQSPQLKSKNENASKQDTIYSPLYLKHFIKKVVDEPNEIQKMLEKVDDEEIFVENGVEKRRHIIELDADRNFSDCEFSDVIANEMLVFNTNMMRSRFDRASIRSAMFYNTLLRWCMSKQANFANSIFIGASFHQASFEETNFSRARFFACEFSNANMDNSTFISTKMEKIIFDETNLSNCKFSSAVIRNCTFNKCNFEQVIFDNNTKFINVIFSGIDFSKVIGLDQAKFKNCVFDGIDGFGCEELNLLTPLEIKEVYVELDEEKSAGVNQVNIYSSPSLAKEHRN